MFRGGFAWLNAVQNMSGEKQWKRKEIVSISEYWSEMSRRSPRKRESLDSWTIREISLTRSFRNLSALIKWEISPVYWNRIKLTAKTVEEDPASCKRLISRKEIPIETGRLYNKASRTPSVIFVE